MNQDKIGKFIASCRKKQKLTQEQLAEKLGITYKAVSKWETGKGLPDASIMMDLCNILEISVNELLNGELISIENKKEKQEKLLLEMAKELAVWTGTMWWLPAIDGVLPIGDIIFAVTTAGLAIALVWTGRKYIKVSNEAAKAHKKIKVTVRRNSKVRYWSATVRAGYVDIGRPLTYSQAVKEVKAGRNYLIFPEGTRSKLGNTMLDFHGGSFRCATKSKCAILSVALVDCFKVLDQKGSAPVTVQIHYLKPIPYEEYAGMKPAEVAALVKQRIQEKIDESV